MSKTQVIGMVALLCLTQPQPASSAEQEPPPAAPAEEAERNLEDWVRGRCPEFTEDQQRAYWTQMHERYRESRRGVCKLTQGSKELLLAPITLGMSLFSADDRWSRCLDNEFDWKFQSQVVNGRLEGYEPGEPGKPSQPNAFGVTLHNNGKLAMRDITLTCDLIGSRLQHISTSTLKNITRPLLSNETRKISVELDPRDRWFCYSMCVYTYTTDY
jgi:hypothetical protein